MAILGVQKPVHEICPNYRFTDGIQCGELASAYGLKPDEWQQIILNDFLGCLKNGTYTAGTCGLAVPRQNGKNAVLEMIELFKSAIQGRKILHTAHEVKTCRKAFLRLKGFFENERKYPELVELVQTVRLTNGQEAILLKNGGSIEFIARSKSSGRGFTVDDVVCDEAQELTDEQLEVLRPTNSAAPSKNPQMILTGTPTPPSSPGTVFERTRKKAFLGTDKRLCWVEWSVDVIGDIYDKKRVTRTNPALGYRLQMSVIEDELASMSDDGFARERLGWWSSTGYKRVIDEKEWKKLCIAKDEVSTEGKKAFGVKFAPDGSKVDISIAVLKDDKCHVELVDEQPMSNGILWLAVWLNERKKTTSCVCIDGAAGANSLCQELIKLKYPQNAIITPSSKNVSSAASMFLNAIHQNEITHIEQEQLDESATKSEKRNIGRNGGWGFGGSVSYPIESAVLAYWAVNTTKRNPSRKSKIL